MNTHQAILPVSPKARATPGHPAEHLVPTDEYATRRLPEAFENFADIIGPLLRHGVPGQVFDVTVFYSKRRQYEDSEHEELLVHNQMAFNAAVRHGGLIIYYQGELLPAVEDGQGDVYKDLGFTPDCMSFCIWESLAHAKAGSKVSEHKKASGHAWRWYEQFGIQKYELTRIVSEKGGKQREQLVLKPVAFKHP